MKRGGRGRNARPLPDTPSPDFTTPDAASKIGVGGSVRVRGPRARTPAAFCLDLEGSSRPLPAPPEGSVDALVSPRRMPPRPAPRGAKPAIRGQRGRGRGRGRGARPVLERAMSDDSIEERRSAASANGAPAKKFAANSVDAATSRDSVKAFRVLFPSGRQIVVRCEQTLKGREFIAMCREKYSKMLTKCNVEELRLYTFTQQMMDLSKPICSDPYVHSCLAKPSVPVLVLSNEEVYMDDAEQASRSASQEEHAPPQQTQPNGARRRPKVPLRTMVSSPNCKDMMTPFVDAVELQFILPGGQSLFLEGKAAATVKDLKKNICEEAQAHNIQLDESQFVLKPVGESQLLTDAEEAKSLMHLPYLALCRSQRKLPKFFLKSRPRDHLTPPERAREHRVRCLIGITLVTSASDEDEISRFRQAMSRVRYQERRRKQQSQQTRTIKNRLSVRITNDPSFDVEQNVLVVVTLPLMGQMKKTVRVEPFESADQLASRIFEKHYAKLDIPDLKPEDFVLKAVGLGEYLAGAHPFSSFEYVRNCIAKNVKINVVLVEAENVKGLAGMDASEEEALQAGIELHEKGNELLDETVVRYDHNAISSESITWQQKTFISTWELGQRLRIQLVGVENLTQYCTAYARVEEDRANWKLYLCVGLFDGGEPIGKLLYSRLVDASPNPRWNQWMEFRVSIRDIPRSARVCFSLLATKGSEPTPSKDLAIAWLNSQLFSFKHELRPGLLSGNMWNDAVANPIGTCVPNAILSAPALFFEFERFQHPVVFPTHPLYEVVPDPPFNCNPNPLMDEILSKDPLYPLTDADKHMVWENRYYVLFNQPRGLPKLLASVPLASRKATEEMHRILARWEPLSALDALELLDSRFSDAKVRDFAVRCLEEFSDTALSTYLLQLVQVLKYEPYHDSALARFLVKRALRSRRVGHKFFWYLKGEMHVLEIAERFGLLMEAYLHGCGAYLDELEKQNEVMNAFTRVANAIKSVPSSDRKAYMIEQLKQIELPSRFQLPLDPSMEVSGLLYEKCKYMDSKKLPLWLVCSNADPTGSPIYVIFKSGDDLRQDMLTLQIIRIMDQVWKKEGLDLKLSPYGCISTGDEVGMIEVVLNSSTTAAITRQGGGAMAAFSKEPIANWLKSHNPTDREYCAAVERFIYSCAGYCVATYVLGIGDRHNDNIMLTKKGQLFHIDFGHFLGNFKKKYGFKRERAKFVLTPDFVHVMGGQKSENFQIFIELCCTAFNILRKHSNRFINLFAMMLSTGIPELTQAKDIDYMREAFFTEVTEQEAADAFTKLIFSCLGSETTKVNNFIHILVRTRIRSHALHEKAR